MDNDILLPEHLDLYAEQSQWRFAEHAARYILAHSADVWTPDEMRAIEELPMLGNSTLVYLKDEHGYWLYCDGWMICSSRHLQTILDIDLTEI